MTRKHWIAIGVVVVVVVLVLINLKAKGGKELPVQVEEVSRKDLEMIISASGSIKPKRQIDISASSIGKVTKVAVKEGDYVEQGQFLIQIDPIQLETTVDRLVAAVEHREHALGQACLPEGRVDGTCTCPRARQAGVG